MVSDSNTPATSIRYRSRKAAEQRSTPLVRPRDVPVYIAAMGPQNLKLTGEIADGWLANAFIPEAAEVFLAPLRQGAQRGGRTLTEIDLVAPVAVEFHDDAASADAAARRLADGYGFTIGAMGANGRNFYNDAFSRLGYARTSYTSTSCGKPGGAMKPAKPSRSTWAGSPTSSVPPTPSHNALPHTKTPESQPCWPSSTEITPNN